MKSVKLKKRTKIIITVIITIILIVSVYCTLWLVRYYKLIVPMTKNENLVLNVSKDMEGMAHKEYEYNGDHISYTVFMPSFPRFGGNLSVLTPTDYDKDWNCITDYSYGLMYKPYLFDDNWYWYSVYDYSEVETINDQSKSVTYDIYTDSQLNFIGGDKEIYDKHYDELKNLYDMAKEFFGEDVFTD